MTEGKSWLPFDTDILFLPEDHLRMEDDIFSSSWEKGEENKSFPNLTHLGF